MTTFLTTLRTLDAAATPGPWESHPGDESWYVMGSENTDAFDDGSAAGQYGPFCTPETRDLIIYLRNHAAALIGCVEALELIKSNTESQLTAMDAIHIPVDAPAYKSAVWHRSISISALAALEEK